MKMARPGALLAKPDGPKVLGSVLPDVTHGVGGVPKSDTAA